MAHRPTVSEDVRHARLFELIRQENVIAERDDCKPQPSSADMRDMQRFLKQAHLSLHFDEGAGE